MVAAITTDDAPVVLVNGDTFYEHFGKHAPGLQKTKFKAVLTATAAAALSYAKHGFDTVLEFVVAPRFFSKLESMARTRGVTVCLIVLLPSKEQCASRAAARKEFAIADYSQFDEFYAKYGDAPAANVLRVQADWDVDAIVAKVRDGLGRGDYVLHKLAAEAVEPEDNL